MTIAIVSEGGAAAGKFGEHLIFPFVEECICLVAFDATTKEYFASHIPGGNWYKDLEKKLKEFKRTNPSAKAYCFGGTETAYYQGHYYGGKKQFEHLQTALSRSGVTMLTHRKPLEMRPAISSIDNFIMPYKYSLSAAATAAACALYAGFSPIVSCIPGLMGCAAGSQFDKPDAITLFHVETTTEKIAQIEKFTVQPPIKHLSALIMATSVSAQFEDNIFGKYPVEQRAAYIIEAYKHREIQARCEQTFRTVTDNRLLAENSNGSAELKFSGISPSKVEYSDFHLLADALMPGFKPEKTIPAF